MQKTGRNFAPKLIGTCYGVTTFCFINSTRWFFICNTLFLLAGDIRKKLQFLVSNHIWGVDPNLNYLRLFFSDEDKINQDDVLKNVFFISFKQEKKYCFRWFLAADLIWVHSKQTCVQSALRGNILKNTPNITPLLEFQLV